MVSALQRLDLGPQRLVVELASNDGYLLQYVQQRCIRCRGIEPTHATAQAARAKGIETLERFSGKDLATELECADFVVANNVLAHVPYINDFMAGIAQLPKPNGRASIEFPHLLQLLKGKTSSSASTTSTAATSPCARCNPSTHCRSGRSRGGRCRSAPHPWGQPAGMAGLSLRRSAHTSRVRPVSNRISGGTGDSGGFCTLSAKSPGRQARPFGVSGGFYSKRQGRRVLGYGAAAKGNTLLQYAGVKPNLLPAVADRATSKQGKLLPGSHIPVITPEQLAADPADTLLVLPWNLIEEVRKQFPDTELVTAIPEFKSWKASLAVR